MCCPQLCSHCGWLLLKCSAIGIGFNGAETNCRIAHILGILLMNSCNTDRFLATTIICSLSTLNSLFVWLFAFSVKTGTRRIIRPDELSSVVRLEQRTTEDVSSGGIMRLVPVFTLETNNLTNNECLPKFVQTDNASSSIKTAIVYVFYPNIELFTEGHYLCRGGGGGVGEK